MTTKRSDIPKKDQWNLEVIFASEADWAVALTKTQERLSQISEYQGKLSEKKNVKDCLDMVADISRELEKIYVYASYKAVTDLSDAHFQGMEVQVQNLASEFSQTISYIRPELVAQPESFLQSCMEDSDFLLHDFDIKGILHTKEHTLSNAEEKLLARASVLWGDVDDIFSKLENVDMKFTPALDSEKKEHEVTHGSYGVLMQSYDRILRENTFRSMHGQFRNHAHTFANTLNAKVKQHHFAKDIRGFDTCLSAALHGNDIDPKVYTTLVNVTEKNVTLLHDAMKIRKKVLKLDTLFPWDLRVSLVDEVDVKYTYDEAVELICEALHPLGDEYVSILREGLYGGWVDKYENEGKRSGAFSGGCHDTFPYILLNFTGSLYEVFTIAHEAGHSMHSYFARKFQPHTKSNYTIFVAEIASTLNERLLCDHLLKTSSSEKLKRYVLSNEIDTIRATFYRQTNFAEFELKIHEEVEKGGTLSVDFLNKEYLEMHERYYGSHLKSDESVAFEWARIPHFYYNFYVYQYATGIALAYKFSDDILANTPSALESYMNLLKSGGNDFPLNQLKKVGVNMMDEAMYDSIFSRFSHLLSAFDQQS